MATAVKAIAPLQNSFAPTADTTVDRATNCWSACPAMLIQCQVLAAEFAATGHGSRQGRKIGQAREIQISTQS